MCGASSGARAGRARVPWLLAAVLGCSPGPRDLVVVTIDTLRADRVGSYGYTDARTPTFDDLARRGARFSDAAATFPRTTPALASLMTGLFPKHHGSREVGQAFHTGRTLAERLAGAGYATVGVTGNAVSGEAQNLHRGFQHFLSGEAASPVTGNALAFAASVPAAQPLFLWVHYKKPHFPYRPPERFVTDGEIGPCRALSDDMLAGRLGRGALYTNQGGASERALPACSRAYDAEIAATDAEVAELFHGLREQGRLPGAYVVFTADHGENLGDAGLWYEHGPSVHEAGLRIPLVVLGPGVRPALHPEPVWLEDLAPTLLALLGIPMDGATDGVDLSPLLRGGPAPAGLASRVMFAESGSSLTTDAFSRPLSGPADGVHCQNEGRFSLCAGPGEEPRLFDHEADPKLTTDLGDRHPEVKARLAEARRLWPAESARERSAREGPFKLVETPRLEGGYARALYDVAADPSETRDVAGAHPEVAARLAEALAAWAPPPPGPAERAPDTVEQLRSLGYVE